MNDDLQPKPWHSAILWLAGGLGLAWGALVAIWPTTTLDWLGWEDGPRLTTLWRCLGLGGSALGAGYLIAARHPYRHWLLILVGLLVKLVFPVVIIMGAPGEMVTPQAITLLVGGNVLFWVPFTMILWGAMRNHESLATVHALTFPDDDPIRELIGSTGQSLAELSMKRPQLVIFLRHAGCTFCRQSLADLREQRESIEATGTGIALVHLGQDKLKDEFFASYQLDDLPRFADPKCSLYRQFGLELGRFSQLFGWKVLWRGMRAMIAGHGIGAVQGNPFQMPGAFVLHCGRLVKGYQHESASDRPDYVQLVHESLPEHASKVLAS